MGWPWITNRRAPPSEVLPPPRIFRPIEAGIEIMKNVVRTFDAGNSLRAAHAALQASEQRIGELQIERAQKLEEAEGDYLTEIDAIDRQLQSLRANIVVHADRIAAMNVKRGKQAQARLEQKKIAGIEIIRKGLGKRLEAARKLDAAHRQMTEAFAECVRADEEAFDTWPAAVSPLGRLGHFRLEAFEALSTRRMRRPPSAGLVRCVAEHEPFNFADDIENWNCEVIEMLESSAPIAEPEDVVAA